MERVATAAQIKEYERTLMQEKEIPSLLLMERAALHVFRRAESYLDSLQKEYKRVCIYVGGGNNGADGLAVARFLKERRDCLLTVVPVGEMNPVPLSRSSTESIVKRALENWDLKRTTEEWKKQKEMLGEIDGLQVVTQASRKVGGLLEAPDLIIDAMVGIGLNRELKELHQHMVERINKSNAYVISVDIPSGLNSDTGLPMPVAVRADETVTFGAIKRGQLLNEGRRYCGKLWVCPIGEELLLNADYRMSRKAWEGRLPERDILGHKGSFGKVLCITGSRDMPGAAILNARAVLHSGAGMVKVLTPFCNRDLLLQAVPEAMFVPKEDCDADRLQKEAAWADVLLYGCGVGMQEGFSIAGLADAPCMIIDADGLNLLASHRGFLLRRKEKGLVTILTPHPGEFARLFPEEEKGACQDPDAVRRLAKEYGVILVAKSATTLVSDGEAVYYNTEGNDGMATAGSGDVLAGIIGALACVCASPMEAAAIGVSLHAHCGDLAAQRKGKAAVTASALIDALSR